MNAPHSFKPEVSGGEIFWDDMADYTSSPFSKRQVVAAGKILAHPIPIERRDDPEVLEAFQIGHSWRSAHLLPMHRLRLEVSRKAKVIQESRVTAARLKRMHSIRKKISNQRISLYQLQDIGGCRVVVESMANLNRLLKRYEEGGSKHKIVRPRDYIRSPRDSGYRSAHIIFKFQGAGVDEVFNRHFIEVQFRTQLQHAWATAVEAVGLVSDQNLKGSEGDPDWLRFFEIMSAEFAIEENSPLVPGVSDNTKERRAELRDLERKLKAINHLESYAKALHFTDSIITASRYYLIQYDYENWKVTVEPFSTYMSGSQRYEAEERIHESRNTVLVEVDKVQDLKEAFPNYFLDVRLFVRRLDDIIHERPRKTQIIQVPRALDFSWVRQWTNRRR